MRQQYYRLLQNMHYIGGTDSSNRPSTFISCLFRLLELEPSKEIIKTYLTQLDFNEFKYLTALTLIYIRLTYPSQEVYSIFDQYFQDFRKLRIKLKTPVFDSQKLPIHYKITFIDEWVDTLLVNERVIDLMLPRLIPRTTLVERGQLAPRQYYIDVSDEEEKMLAKKKIMIMKVIVIRGSRWLSVSSWCILMFRSKISRV